MCRTSCVGLAYGFQPERGRAGGGGRCDEPCPAPPSNSPTVGTSSSPAHDAFPERTSSCASRQYCRFVPPLDESDEDRPQPAWTVYFDEDGGGERVPSRFVEVTITHQLEVVDADALREAVAASAGPPRDDLDVRLRAVPANLVGLALSGPLSLPLLPGVERRDSGLSVGEYEPENR